MRAIVYVSETGHTARYAALLSERTGLPAISLDEAERTLPSGTEIFFLGWLMAHSLKGYGRVKRRFVLRGVAAVGLSDVPNGAVVLEAAKNGGVAKGARVFYLQGGYSPEKLRGMDRWLMKLVERTKRRQLAGKENLTARERAELELLAHGGDCVRAENLKEILTWFSGQN